MDISTFARQLEARLQEQRNLLPQEQDEKVQTSHFLATLRTCISELKQFTHTYQFRDDAEEITFFKEIKPLFLSQYFYHKKILVLQLFDPCRDTSTRTANYLRCLRQLERYIKRNFAFYEYCMANETHRDRHYFTRSRLIELSPNSDESFTTGYDTRLARLLANEMLRAYLFRRLQSATTTEPASAGLTWTGSKTDLIELIYALQSAEVLNNGAAPIKLIASAFETLLHVSLGDYYRTFQDIRIRKKSQSPFLDLLKEKFLSRLNIE